MHKPHQRLNQSFNGESKKNTPKKEISFERYTRLLNSEWKKWLAERNEQFAKAAGIDSPTKKKTKRVVHRKPISQQHFKLLKEFQLLKESQEEKDQEKDQMIRLLEEDIENLKNQLEESRDKEVAFKNQMALYQKDSEELSKLAKKTILGCQTEVETLQKKIDNQTSRTIRIANSLKNQMRKFSEENVMLKQKTIQAEAIANSFIEEQTSKSDLSTRLEAVVNQLEIPQFEPEQVLPTEVEELYERLEQAEALIASTFETAKVQALQLERKTELQEQLENQIQIAKDFVDKIYLQAMESKKLAATLERKVSEEQERSDRIIANFSSEIEKLKAKAEKHAERFKESKHLISSLAGFAEIDNDPEMQDDIARAKAYLQQLETEEESIDFSFLEGLQDSYLQNFDISNSLVQHINQFQSNIRKPAEIMGEINDLFNQQCHLPEDDEDRLVQLRKDINQLKNSLSMF